LLHLFPRPFRFQQLLLRVKQNRIRNIILLISVKALHIKSWEKILDFLFDGAFERPGVASSSCPDLVVECESIQKEHPSNAIAEASESCESEVIQNFFITLAEIANFKIVFCYSYFW